MPSCLRNAFSLLVISLTMLASTCSMAAYPDKPVTLVVPYAAGGPTDVAARLIAQELGKRLSITFIVENRVGAGGNIGAAFVARAPADGYTLLMIGIAHTINKTLYKNINYDVERDFTPVSLVAHAPLILLSSPQMPASTVKDFIAFAKASSPSLNYMSQGVGSAPHIAMELLKTRTGVSMTHIPYKGSAPALTDLMGNQVSVGFDSLVVGQPLVTAGKLKALAVTGAVRAPGLPDVPTMIESGFANLDSTTWYGVAAPARTSQDIVNLLSRHIVEILQTPDVRARIAGLGGTPAPTTPQEFQKFLSAEVAKWADAVKQSGATAE
jgi:tripartite-type tricarboxylate transporter receptor subunit TctC